MGLLQRLNRVRRDGKKKCSRSNERNKLLYDEKENAFFSIITKNMT